MYAIRRTSFFISQQDTALHGAICDNERSCPKFPPHLAPVSPHYRVIFRQSQYWLQIIAQFSDINILQGNVATHLRCGGIFSDQFSANLLASLLVKNFENRLRFDSATP